MKALQTIRIEKEQEALEKRGQYHLIVKVLKKYMYDTAKTIK